MQTMVNETEKSTWANANFGALYFARDINSQTDFAGTPRYARFSSLHSGMIPRAVDQDVSYSSGQVSGVYLALVENTGEKHSDPFDGPVVSPLKPKRKAMKLRLEQPNHRQLRLAGAHTGRTSQDILFTAMHLYLDELA